METEIIHREKLDREPTMLDRMNKVGLEGFIAKLREAKWVNNSADVKALVPFHVKYEGHAEERNNYVEWRAKLEIQN